MGRNSPRGRRSATSTNTVSDSARNEGDCYDNAMIESVWARMQTELLDRKEWTTIFEPGTEIDDHIDCFHKRRRSLLAVVTPDECENRYAPMPQLALARPRGQTIRDQKSGDIDSLLHLRFQSMECPTNPNRSGQKIASFELDPSGKLRVEILGRNL